MLRTYLRKPAIIKFYDRELLENRFEFMLSSISFYVYACVNEKPCRLHNIFFFNNGDMSNYYLNLPQHNLTLMVSLEK